MTDPIDPSLSPDDPDPLAVLVGDHPRTRILLALLDAYPRGLSVSTITDNADFGARSTVYDHLDDLQATGMVVVDDHATEQARGTIYRIPDTNDDDRTALLQQLRASTHEKLRETGYYHTTEQKPDNPE